MDRPIGAQFAEIASGFVRARGLALRLARPLALAACAIASGRAEGGRRGPAVHALGLSFPSPIGIAAGFDPGGRAGRRLGRLGFGAVEAGTVTLVGQPGRSASLAEVSRRLRQPVAPQDRATVQGVTVGAALQTRAEAATAEMAACLSELWPLADMFTITLCGPGGCMRWPAADATRVLREMATWLATWDGSGRRPVAVKLPAGPAQVALAEEAAACGFAAIVAEHAAEGILARLSGLLPVIAVGGIRHAADVGRRLDSGASLVQVCRPLMWGGPVAAFRLCQYSAERLCQQS